MRNVRFWAGDQGPVATPGGWCLAPDLDSQTAVAFDLPIPGEIPPVLQPIAIFRLSPSGVSGRSIAMASYASVGGSRPTISFAHIVPATSRIIIRGRLGW